MTYVNIYGEPIDTISVPVAAKTHRGYAGIPGTGPNGETCGSCKHHVVREYSKRYHKCDLMRARWTGGAGTDIKVRAPACKRWEKAE